MALAAESYLIANHTPSWKSLHPITDQCGGESWVLSLQLGTALKVILSWELSITTAEASVPSASRFNVSFCPMLLLCSSPLFLLVLPSSPFPRACCNKLFTASISVSACTITKCVSSRKQGFTIVNSVMQCGSQPPVQWPTLKNRKHYTNLHIYGSFRKNWKVSKHWDKHSKQPE